MTTISRSVLALSLLSVLGPVAFGQLATKPEGAVRFATFNASLNRNKAGELLSDLSTPDNAQAQHVAEVIQRVRPDVLLINEFDDDPEGRSADLFRKNYLAKGQGGAEAIDYPYAFRAEVNTGVASGLDLDNDGQAASTPGSCGYGNDAFGFGLFPGQYGMLVLSAFPIDEANVVQFQKVLWKDMPGALLPAKPDGSPWFDEKELAAVRLSSKSHWDVPIKVGGKTVHLLASHPTPPAFDGPERRNQKRNHDEIRVWADYLSGGEKVDYLRKAVPGVRLDPPETFVIVGDQNADPVDGNGVPGSIDQLLKHPKVNAANAPKSPGAAGSTGGPVHKGDPATDTADFGGVGRLRVDYVLPSKDLDVLGSGVFWPAADDPLSKLVGMKPVATSDHRLVYLDVKRP